MGKKKDAYLAPYSFSVNQYKSLLMICGFEVVFVNNYFDTDWHPYYQKGKLHTMQSVSKSITSLLIGIAIDNAAFALGASWVERHFTKDRTWKGTDHAASLEPTGLRKLARDLKATHKALTFKQSDILEIEKVQRDKLKYRKQ